MFATCDTLLPTTFVATFAALAVNTAFDAFATGVRTFAALAVDTTFATGATTFAALAVNTAFATGATTFATFDVDTVFDAFATTFATGTATFATAAGTCGTSGMTPCNIKCHKSQRVSIHDMEADRTAIALAPGCADATPMFSSSPGSKCM